MDFKSNVSVRHSKITSKIYMTLLYVGQQLLLVLTRTLFLLKSHFLRISTWATLWCWDISEYAYIALILILGKICGIRVGDTLGTQEIWLEILLLRRILLRVLPSKVLLVVLRFWIWMFLNCTEWFLKLAEDLIDMDFLKSS